MVFHIMWSIQMYRRLNFLIFKLRISYIYMYVMQIEISCLTQNHRDFDEKWKVIYFSR